MEVTFSLKTDFTAAEDGIKNITLQLEALKTLAAEVGRSIGASLGNGFAMRPPTKSGGGEPSPSPTSMPITRTAPGDFSRIYDKETGSLKLLYKTTAEYNAAIARSKAVLQSMQFPVERLNELKAMGKLTETEYAQMVSITTADIDKQKLSIVKLEEEQQLLIKLQSGEINMLKMLKAERLAAQNALGAMSQTFGPNSPEVVAAQQRLAMLNAQIKGYGSAYTTPPVVTTPTVTPPLEVTPTPVITTGPVTTPSQTPGVAPPEYVPQPTVRPASQEAPKPLGYAQIYDSTTGSLKLLYRTTEQYTAAIKQEEGEIAKLIAYQKQLKTELGQVAITEDQYNSEMVESSNAIKKRQAALAQLKAEEQALQKVQTGEISILKGLRAELAAANQALGVANLQFGAGSTQSQAAQSRISSLTAQIAALSPAKVTPVTKALNNLTNVGSIGTRIFGQFTSMMSGFFGVFAAYQLIKSAISTIREFEYAMANVGAVTQATSADLAFLKASALELSKTTMFSPKEVADLELEFSKLGFTVREVMQATAPTANLATATQEGIASTAELVGNIVRTFKINTSETQRITDVLAESFNRSALDLTRFREAIKYVAPVAKASNFTLEETSAILMKLADAGIYGSQAGTALRNVLSKMATPNSKLAQELGGTVQGFDGLVAVLKKFKNEGTDLSHIFQIMDRWAAASFTQMVSAADDIEFGAKALKKAGEDGTAAMEMARIQMDTVEGASKKLGNAWKALMISVGDSGLRSGWKDFLNGVANEISALTGNTESLKYLGEAFHQAFTGQMELTKVTDLKYAVVKLATEYNQYIDALGKGELVQKSSSSIVEEFNRVNGELTAMLGVNIMTIDKETGKWIINTNAIDTNIKKRQEGVSGAFQAVKEKYEQNNKTIERNLALISKSEEQYRRIDEEEAKMRSVKGTLGVLGSEEFKKLRDERKAVYEITKDLTAENRVLLAEQEKNAATYAVMNRLIDNAGAKTEDTVGKMILAWKEFNKIVPGLFTNPLFKEGVGIPYYFYMDQGRTPLKDENGKIVDISYFYKNLPAGNGVINLFPEVYANLDKEKKAKEDNRKLTEEEDKKILAMKEKLMAQLQALRDMETSLMQESLAKQLQMENDKWDKERENLKKTALDRQQFKEEELNDNKETELSEDIEGKNRAKITQKYLDKKAALERESVKILNEELRLAEEKHKVALEKINKDYEQKILNLRVETQRVFLGITEQGVKKEIDLENLSYANKIYNINREVISDKEKNIKIETAYYDHFVKMADIEQNYYKKKEEIEVAINEATMTEFDKELLKKMKGYDELNAKLDQGLKDTLTMLDEKRQLEINVVMSTEKSSTTKEGTAPDKAQIDEDVNKQVLAIYTKYDTLKLEEQERYNALSSALQQKATADMELSVFNESFEIEKINKDRNDILIDMMRVSSSKKERLKAEETAHMIQLEIESENKKLEVIRAGMIAQLEVSKIGKGDLEKNMIDAQIKALKSEDWKDAFKDVDSEMSKAFPDVTKAIATIGKLQADLKKTLNPLPGKSIWQVIGLVTSDEDASAFQGMVDATISGLKDLVSAEEEATKAIVDNYNQRINEKEAEVQAEATLQAAGIANNLAAKQKEAEMLKKKRDDALAEQQKYAKQMQAIETVVQTMNLISAASSIVKSIAEEAGWGALIAAPIALGALFAIWKSTRLAAINSNTPTHEKGTTVLLGGERHSKGGTPLGVLGEGEQGERVSIFSRKATEKYGPIIERFTNIINNSENYNATQKELARLAIEHLKLTDRELLDELPGSILPHKVKIASSDESGRVGGMFVPSAFKTASEGLKMRHGTERLSLNPEIGKNFTREVQKAKAVEIHSRVSLDESREMKSIEKYVQKIAEEKETVIDMGDHVIIKGKGYKRIIHKNG